MILIAKIFSFVLRSMLSSKMRPSPRTTGRKVVCKLYQRFGQINVGNLAGIPCCTSGTEPSTNNAGIGRLRSSNCNSDTIDGLPNWVVVEKQEYDLPKEAFHQLNYCYKI